MIESFVNQVIHGDCITVMQEMPSESVDLVVTDPPFVTRFRSRDGRVLAGDNTTHWIGPAYEHMYRVLKPHSCCITTYGWNTVDVFMRAWRAAGFRAVSHFVWVKRYASRVLFTRGQHQLAYLLIKGEPPKPADPPSDVLQWKYSGNLLHPTQQGVASLTPLIRAFSAPGDIILDPFAGSGTTAVAALYTGRRFIAIELVEEYYRIARDRLERWKKGEG